MGFFIQLDYYDLCEKLDFVSWDNYHHHGATPATIAAAHDHMWGVLRRNFWFCAIDDASGFLTRDVIGVDHLLVESDYPHADSTWPDTQPRLREQLAGVPDDEVRRICWANAVELFRLPAPAVELP